MLIVHETIIIKRKVGIMNNTTKSIINNIFDELFALQESIDSGAVGAAYRTKEPATEKVELLTIKESAELISGLSEHTVRQLVKQGKVKSVRTGEGRNGKILVNKADLVAYFSKKEA